MKKQTKKKETIVFYKGKDGDVLSVTPSFHYEMQVFSFHKQRFNLLDSTITSSTTKLKNLETWEIKKDVKLKKEYVLIGAPEKWLKENNYEKIEQ